LADAIGRNTRLPHVLVRKDCLKQYKQHIGLAIAVTLLGAALCFPPAAAQSVRADQFKAVYLSNSVKVIDWPVEVLPANEAPLNSRAPGCSPVRDAVHQKIGPRPLALACFVSAADERKGQ
jgi:hypothetical protein